MNFEHDYVLTSEFSPSEKTLCMKCEAVIADHRYEDQPSFKNPKEIIHIRAKRKLGIYRQVPLVSVEDGNMRLIHALVCEGCQTFEFTPEIGSKIVNQIRRATEIQMAWAGYPEEALAAVRDRFAGMAITRRLAGEELRSLYRQENINASNI